MGLFGKSKKERIAELESQVAEMSAMLTPEMRDAIALNERIQQLQSEENTLDEKIQRNNEEIIRQTNNLEALNEEIQKKKKENFLLDDEIALQDFGVHKPVYKFANSEQYKDRLALVRQKEKDLIRNKTAASFPSNFTYNNSLAKGRAVVNDNVKQILRSFNNECDVLINNVKFNTVETTRNKIMKSYEQLNKMNSRMEIKLNTQYLDLKLDELNLAYEYAQKKEEEKEARKEERERLREEAKLQKEIEAARADAIKEKKHYENALAKLKDQILNSPNDEDLKAKQAELEEHLESIDANLKDIDYREANKRAGYVYVISNLGSFGKNIYKIGMTRRLDPMDRVNELGDASVPFNFDVHAMIFTDDAPKLEAALHNAFADKKVNMINQRREFFNVSLDEIKEVVKKNYDKTVEFVDIPAAQQYRETLMLKNKNAAAAN